MFDNKKLEQARREKGLSITNFMFELDRFGMRISPPTLYRWENGEAIPDANEVGTLAQFFNKPIQYFFKKNTDKTCQVNSNDV